jgi:hypothetical protein
MKLKMVRERKVGIRCLILLLLLQFPAMLVYAEAEHDWIVRLRQSPGTKAAVTGGWTKDGERIDHPGGFYTLSCDGEEKTTRIPKENIATEPNDADYEIRIWWPDGSFESHESEKIPAPGSKTYSHSPISVVFEVLPDTATAAPPSSVPGLAQWSLIILASLLVVFVICMLWRKRKRAV